MSKAKLGNKQVCPSCESKFYDLNKNPVVCPKCGNSFDPLDNVVLSKAAKIKEKEAAKVVPNSDDDEDDEDQVTASEADDIDEEVDTEVAKELGGDDEEIVRETAAEESDDDGPGSEPRVPQGFTEEGIDGDDDILSADDDDDDYALKQANDIGIDEDFDQTDAPPTPPS